ncbi:MAG: hypothetical protein RJB65_254 [Actinomycetota bacterium]
MSNIALMAKKAPEKHSLSKEHKAAMAVGRVEGRIVRDYLEAIRMNKGKPGRKRTPDSISRRLVAIENELAVANAVQELELIQERLDLQTELAAMTSKVDPASLEADFARVAQAYSKRRGISYAAWRAVGVEPSVLKKAGITR